MCSYCLILVVIIGCILTAGFFVYGATLEWRSSWLSDCDVSMYLTSTGVYVVRRSLTPSPWLTVRVQYLEPSNDWSADRLVNLSTVETSAHLSCFPFLFLHVQRSISAVTFFSTCRIRVCRFRVFFFVLVTLYSFCSETELFRVVREYRLWT